MKNTDRKITVRTRTHADLAPIANAGFSGIDIELSGFSSEEDLFARLKTAQHLGLPVGQTHLSTCPRTFPPLAGSGCKTNADFLIPTLRREIELTAMLGADVAVMHPYYLIGETAEDYRNQTQYMIESLLPTLEQFRVTLALENTYGANLSDAFHERPEQMLYYVEYFSSEYLGLCLDTGHACIRGQDPIKLAKAYGRHLKALHVHAGFFGQDNHAIPAVTNGDIVNWDAFCDTLDVIGYEGNFNLEIKPCRSLPQGALSAYYHLAYSVAENLLKRSTNV